MGSSFRGGDQESKSARLNRQSLQLEDITSGLEARDVIAWGDARAEPQVRAPHKAIQACKVETSLKRTPFRPCRPQGCFALLTWASVALAPFSPGYNISGLQP